MRIEIDLDDKYLAVLQPLLAEELKERQEAAHGELYEKAHKAALAEIREEDQKASNPQEKQAVQNKLHNLTVKYTEDEKAKLKPLTVTEYFARHISLACKAAAKKAKEARVQAAREAIEAEPD